MANFLTEITRTLMANRKLLSLNSVETQCKIWNFSSLIQVNELDPTLSINLAFYSQVVADELNWGPVVRTVDKFSSG